MLIKICSYLTQFLKENHQNSTWKSLHVSHNIVCSQICHKHIHIMGWKDQTSKEIATCGKFVSLSSCCEKAAAGMLRPFPVHFIPLQSNSTDCDVYDSHADTENCMKFIWVFIWNRLLEKLLWREVLNEFGHFMQMQITDNGRSNRMLHINHAQGLHVNLDSFISDTVSQRKSSKFHLKIPACESQHILQSKLSQIHSYHGVKRPKKKRNSNLWEVCFSSAAVGSKLLLGCWGNFLYILCHCNSTAHSVMCTVHM